MIIGCGGSGKSTLARRLGKILALPVYHLDQLYWKPGWVETPTPEWVSILVRLCSQTAWILDGNYGGTMDLRLISSDTVIFLDMPTRVCLSGAMRRLWTFRGRTRPDLVPGCPERLDFKYLFWICTYRRRRRPRLLSKLERFGGEKSVVILKSRQAVTDFVNALQRESGYP
jgi:adenylate kinase family enzyme